MNSNKIVKYRIEGMHCPSCEVLIEKKIRKTGETQKVNVSLAKKTAVITLKNGKNLSAERLNELLGPHGYKFTSDNIRETQTHTKKSVLFLKTLPILLGLIIVFFILQKTGIASQVKVDTSSALPAFFVLGLIAGTSSCAALVGGLLLSLTGKWNNLYRNDNQENKAYPFILFNTGRLASFTILGGVLGTLGKALQLSLSVSSFLVILITVVMFILGLQMIGVEWAKKIQFRLPKSVTSHISDEDNFQGKLMPLSIGALTFFLPCGFTFLAQTIALASGSFLRGSLIMLLFALGTLPMLGLISFSSMKMSKNSFSSEKFSFVAGVLVIIFSLFNLNSQLNILGFKSLSDINLNKNTPKEQTVAAAPVGNEQFMQMEAGSFEYSPRYFKLKAGIPVKWQIYNEGASGCSSSVVARGLVDNVIELQPGMNEVEFTPKKPGTYKITCWMGMVPPVTVEVTN